MRGNTPYLLDCMCLKFKLNLDLIGKLKNCSIKLKLTHATACTLFYLIEKWHALSYACKLSRITLSLPIYCCCMHACALNAGSLQKYCVPSSLLHCCALIIEHRTAWICWDFHQCLYGPAVPSAILQSCSRTSFAELFCPYLYLLLPHVHLGLGHFPRCQKLTTTYMPYPNWGVLQWNVLVYNTQGGTLWLEGCGLGVPEIASLHECDGPDRKSVV